MGREKTGRPIDTPVGSGVNVTGQDQDRRAPLIPPGAVTYIYSGQFRQTTKTATFTLSNEMVVLVDASACAIVLTLPPAATNPHKVYYIKKIDTTGHAVTIKGATPAEKIDNEKKFTIVVPMTCITPICDGSDWWVI